MKKKILLIFTCLLVLIAFCVTPIQCLALEAESGTGEPTDTTEADLPTEEQMPSESVSAPSTAHTIFTRVYEYCVENKTEVLGLVGDAVIFILAIFVKLRNDKKTKEIANVLGTVKDDTKGTASAQTSVVGAVNGMIDSYNGMREAYEKYESTEDDRNRLVGAVMVQNTALLEILQTVYVNNKNLPQGTKDLVNQKYANCLKALNDDDLLRSIVEAVREKVGTTQATESDSSDAEGV